MTGVRLIQASGIRLVLEDPAPPWPRPPRTPVRPPGPLFLDGPCHPPDAPG